MNALTRISGAVVEAECEEAVSLGEVVYVGRDKLLGEIVALDKATAIAQVYEDTSGLAPGDPLEAVGDPLLAELGPGLLGNVFDGIQRPLPRLAEAQGDFLLRGLRAPALDRDKLWQFTPALKPGAHVEPGMVLGTVPETSSLLHRILATASGELSWIAAEGPARVADVIAQVGGQEQRMMQTWRVRTPRPCQERLPLALPMITGQRVLDTFFPIPLGGAAGLPGGFGTGKTVLQHQLCKWADADVIVYVGCGERGNEITRMLRELPELSDPRSGRPLAERTVIIANTSNMPVAARESSVFTGVTIAEYYRDMGYRVAMLADSTSRWAEALREISGRLGEMPAEEGYPPYLSSRLAAFYERAGRVTTLGGAEGSVTLISAISPPGGDLTEPVTRHTQAYTRSFWTLDKDLAAARFFPAINVQSSWGDAPAALEEWWEHNGGEGWTRLRRDALALLGEAQRLEGTARLIGTESLPERQRFLLGAASVIEDGFLQQSAMDPREARESPERQFALLELLMHFYAKGLAALQKKPMELPLVSRLRRARSSGEDLPALRREIDEALS